jgi:hypothetical protein
MKRSDESFAGYECVCLENQAVKVWVTKDVGPRIIGLQTGGGDNLLAVVPGLSAVTPGGNRYHFRGGHRLWYAPEDPERTYLPDDSAVTITEIENGIRTTQTVEPTTSIEKEMSISLPDDSAQVVIEHALTNRGGGTAVDLAPWSITQLKAGGFAILPQSTENSGLLPNRQLAFWPYSDINSTQLKLGNEFLFVAARMENERFKIGWPNPVGWLAYWVDGTLFVKEAAYQAGAEYFDFGSSSECYCDDNFLELETLGKRTLLEPGERVTHLEVWRIYPEVVVEMDETAVGEKLRELGVNGISAG